MELNNIEAEINHLGLEAIKKYFKTDIEKIDPKIIRELCQKAKLGMQFTREFKITQRAIENNFIRAFRAMAEDKKELKKYICASMPKYKEIVEEKH